jgi:CcmD family protein
MGYLFGAYFVLWAATFGYLFFLGSRQKQLQRDLDLLIQEKQASTSSAQDKP